MDVDTGETVTLEVTMTTQETNITFTISLLRKNRHYSLAFTASNGRGQATSETMISMM